MYNTVETTELACGVLEPCKRYLVFGIRVIIIKKYSFTQNNGFRVKTSTYDLPRITQGVFEEYPQKSPKDVNCSHLRFPSSGRGWTHDIGK